MTLKKKLLLSTAVEVLLVAAASVFLLASSKHINQATDSQTKSTKIVDTVTQIRFVTFENLLHHDKRSFEQWQLKHNELVSLLHPLPSQSPAERAVLDSIMTDSKAVVPIFNRLVTSYTEPATTPEAIAIQKAFQERLATQLLVKQQNEISEALRLNALGLEQADNSRQQANRLVIGVILLMLFIATLEFLFVTRNITKVLTVLETGAKKIARGRYDYRITTRSSSNELGQLAKAFNSMATSLQQTDKVRSEFILMASHQLRMPLTAIKWSAELLTSAKRTLTPQKRQEYLDQIHQSNERMIDLVNALLQVSKIDFGILTEVPSAIKLDESLDEVLKGFSTTISDQKITIKKHIAENLESVSIDQSWVRTIFHNLISNAIKYSSPKGHVTISISELGPTVLITVTDDGIGIPPDQQTSVFTKLFRADNARQLDAEGSGLGLYICKAIVEQAGGSIWFETNDNKGTIFHVKLPHNS